MTAGCAESRFNINLGSDRFSVFNKKRDIPPKLLPGPLATKARCICLCSRPRPSAGFSGLSAWCGAQSIRSGSGGAHTGRTTRLMFLTIALVGVAARSVDRGLVPSRRSLIRMARSSLRPETLSCFTTTLIRAGTLR